MKLILTIWTCYVFSGFRMACPLAVPFTMRKEPRSFQRSWQKLKSWVSTVSMKALWLVQMPCLGHSLESRDKNKIKKYMVHLPCVGFLRVLFYLNINQFCFLVWKLCNVPCQRTYLNSITGSRWAGWGRDHFACGLHVLLQVRGGHGVRLFDPDW